MLKLASQTYDMGCFKLYNGESGIKNFLGNFFIGGFTGSAPEMTIVNNFHRVFRPYLTYRTCFSWSMVIIISVILVMAINYRKKFELRVGKKRNC